jgi:hypothetical protein
MRKFVRPLRQYIELQNGYCRRTWREESLQVIYNESTYFNNRWLGSSLPFRTAEEQKATSLTSHAQASYAEYRNHKPRGGQVLERLNSGPANSWRRMSWSRAGPAAADSGGVDKSGVPVDRQTLAQYIEPSSRQWESSVDSPEWVTAERVEMSD